MLRIWRYLWRTTAALLGLLVLSLLIISQLDFNRFKGTIETQVSELTGRKLKIDGNLQIDFSLQPQIIIEQASFANATWGKQPHMLSLELLQLKIQLMPLLENKLVVEQLLVKGVNLSVEVNNDGQLNWLLEELASDTTEENDEPKDSEPFQMPIQLVLKQVQLKAINFSYSDAVAGIKTDTVLESLELTNNGLDKAINFSANGTVNQHPFTFFGETHFQTAKATQSQTKPNQAQPNQKQPGQEQPSQQRPDQQHPGQIEHGMLLRFNADALGIALTADGIIERPTLAEGIEIKLTLDADDLEKSFTAATGKSIHQYVRKSKQPLALKFSADFSDKNDGYGLSTIKLKLADNDINGDLHYKSHLDRPTVTAKLQSDNINLNQLLAEQTTQNKATQIAETRIKSPVNEHQNTESKISSHTNLTEVAINLSDTTLPFELLNTLNADITYEIKQLQIDEFSPQEIKLDLSLRDGLLKIKQFDLKLDDEPIRSSLIIDDHYNNSGANNNQTNIPTIHFTLNIESLQLGKISNRLQIEQFKSGLFRSDIKLNTSGKSIKSLVMNLNGKANIQLADVMLEHQIKELKHRANIQQFKLDFTDINAPLDYILAGTVDGKPLSLSGQLDSPASALKNETVNLKLKLKFSDNDIEGDIQLKNHSDRPEIIAKLQSDNVDLNQLLPKQTEGHKGNKNSKEKEVENSTNEISNENTEKTAIKFPDTTLPFDLLNSLNAKITYDIKQFQIDEFKPQEIKLDLSLQNGLLQIKQFDLKLDGKPVQSSLIIDNRPNTKNNKAIIPKINITLNIKSFQLGQISKRLQIEQFKSGLFQSDINLDTYGNSIKSLVMNLNGKAHIQLSNARLEHQIENKNHTANINQLNIDFSGVDKPFSYDLDGTVDGSPLSLYGELDSPISIIENKTLKLKLELAAVKAKLTIDGDIDQPLNADTAKLNISLDIPKPKESVIQISRLTHKVKPNDAIPEAPFSVHGLLTASPNTYRIENLQANLGESDLSGELFADFRGEKPFIDAKFESQLLDLNTLVPTTKQKPDDNTQNVKPLQNNKNPKPKTNKLFSNEPLPALDVLNDIDINLSFNLKRLISNKQRINNISLKLAVKDSRLKLDPLSIELAEGTLVSTLEVNILNKPRFRFNQKITKLNYGNLMTLLGIKEYAKGKLDADINLTGEGNSVSDLMASLNGKIRVTTVDGELDNISLKLLSKDIVSVIPFTNTSNRQKIHCAVMQFNINDGIASTHAMVVNTGSISALGTGKIDLTKENLTLYVAPRSKRTSIAQLALVPVNITGPINSPSVLPDITGSTISATKAYTNIGLTVATGGLWLLAEGYTNKLWDKFIDDTDYCARALAGDKIVPRRIKLEDDVDKAKDEAQELSDLLNDDENDW